MFQNVSLFQDLPEADLNALSSRAVTPQYRPQTVVIGQGDESDSLYLVISGRLKVYCSDEDGKEVILASLEPGDSSSANWRCSTRSPAPPRWKPWNPASWRLSRRAISVPFSPAIRRWRST